MMALTAHHGRDDATYYVMEDTTWGFQPTWQLLRLPPPPALETLGAYATEEEAERALAACLAASQPACDDSRQKGKQ